MKAMQLKELPYLDVQIRDIASCLITIIDWRKRGAKVAVDAGAV